MKNLLTIVTVLTVIIVTAGACTTKHNGKETVTANEKETLSEQVSGNDLIAQGKALIDVSDCKTCHHTNNKTIGPGYVEVANRYEYTQSNVTMLAKKIIGGGGGVWGDMPMAAHTDISNTDAEKMAHYILSLDGEEIK